MAQYDPLYENDYSRMINSLINQWNSAYRSQNKLQMATVLRSAAKLSYSRGNKKYAQEMIATALAILPQNSPLYSLTYKDATFYSASSIKSIASQPSNLNQICKILASI